ncbi:MAG: hypothetical protein WC603_01600 [Candidatus Paceibacterota bacterium]|jgi:hypothetical protein
MKKRNSILILILSLITTLLVLGALGFFLRIIKNKNQHISVSIATLEKKLKDKEEIVTFAEKLSEIESIRDTISSRFIDPNKIDTFVNYLEDLDSDIGSDIAVKNIEISPKVKNSIAFKILITGTFQEVMETISLLENIPYEVDVTQVYLNKDLAQVIDTQDEKQTPVIKVSTWQADIAFNILSSN